MMTHKSRRDPVLLIDDDIDDLMWLVERIEAMGFGFVCATNEAEARDRILAISEGRERYCLAVIDVMMATHSIEHVGMVDEKFFKSSKESGVRLCHYARVELGISAAELPIAVYTARVDEQARQQIGAIPDVRHFFRDGAEGEGSLDHHVAEVLQRSSGD
ncbi:MAG: hypothetical protein R3B70_48095 [Polyangiaceae bacterium]